jgi:hypothetical protein
MYFSLPCSFNLSCLFLSHNSSVFLVFPSLFLSFSLYLSLSSSFDSLKKSEKIKHKRKTKQWKEGFFFQISKEFWAFILFSYFGFCVVEKLILSQISKTKNKSDNNSDLLYHSVHEPWNNISSYHIINKHLVLILGCF